MHGLYLESYKVIPKKELLGGLWVGLGFPGVDSCSGVPDLESELDLWLRFRFQASAPLKAQSGLGFRV